MIVRSRLETRCVGNSGNFNTGGHYHGHFFPSTDHIQREGKKTTWTSFCAIRKDAPGNRNFCFLAAIDGGCDSTMAKKYAPVSLYRFWPGRIRVDHKLGFTRVSKF